MSHCVAEARENGNTKCILINIPRDNDEKYFHYVNMFLNMLLNWKSAVESVRGSRLEVSASDSVLVKQCSTIFFATHDNS